MESYQVTNDEYLMRTLLLFDKGIVEGRGANNGQIGMAAVDLNRPGVEISQFIDTDGYSGILMKMLVWMPVEVSS